MSYFVELLPCLSRGWSSHGRGAPSLFSFVAHVVNASGAILLFQSTMMDGIKDCVDSITDAYTCLLNGSPPNQIACDLVTNICAVLSRNVTLQDDSCLLCARSNAAKCSHVNVTELTCITLTLVDKMHGDLMSQTMQPKTILYLSQIHKVFQEAHVMSTLVSIQNVLTPN